MAAIDLNSVRATIEGRLATELALVREPHILDDPKKSLAYINSI